MEIEPVGILRRLTANEERVTPRSSVVAIESNHTVSGGRLRIGDCSHAVVTAWVETGGVGKAATRAARVLDSMDNRLVVEGLDWPDGTAILSVEGYVAQEHCVFSARAGEDAVFPAGREDAGLLVDMIAEAARFHGETCAGVVLGAKIMLHLMKAWQVGHKDPRLHLWLGSDGCIGDALIALSGATLGTGRLKVPGGRIYRFVMEDKGLAYYPTDQAFAPAAEVLAKPVEELFAIREETQRSGERKPAHDKRTPRHAQEEEALVQRVRDSLVDGKLSCAMAYKIADEMSVHIVDVGRAADEARVKISHCQLGCFR